MKPSLRCALLVALSLTAMPGARAAEPAAPQTPQDDTFVESFDVTVANVEVFVTDRQGKPLAGLTREDFEIFENGRQVEIVNFFAQSEEVAEAEVTGEAEGPAAAAPSPGRTIGIFVDNRHLELPARARFFEKLRPFLLERAAGDRLLLFLYDRALKVRRFQGSDRTGIESAVAEVLASSSSASELRMDRQIVIREIELADSQIGLSNAYSAIRLFAEKQLHETRATLDALDQSARILSGMPGHKVLLYASNGLDLRPAEALFEMLGAAQGGGGGASVMESREFDASSSLRRVVDRANAGRVTFYAIGLPLGGDVEIRTALQGAEIRHAQAFNHEVAMLDLAGGTGGTAAFDPANPGILLAQISRDLATFYSLGYTPRPGKVGKNRTIKVKVKQPGLTVRYRETFRTKEPEEATRERLLSALHLGEYQNPLGLKVDFAPIERAGKNKLNLEVTIQFPISRLTLLPATTGPKGLARLYIASRDDDGGTSEITEIAIPIRLSEKTAEVDQLRTAGYKTTLQIRDEPTVLAFALRDVQGNADSTLVLRFLPPPPPEPEAKTAAAKPD